MIKHLLIPLILFPYTLLLALCCLFSDFLREMLLRNNILALLLPLIFCFALSCACALTFCIGSIRNKSPGREMAKRNMLVKLWQIPAYLVIFACGWIACLFSIWGGGFILAFFLYDCATIAMSGLIGAAAVIRNFREHRLTAARALLLGWLQFVFCADIIACILLYLHAKRQPPYPQNNFMWCDTNSVSSEERRYPNE